MKIVRFQTGTHPEFGILEGDQIYPCFGDPFEGLSKHGKPLLRDSVKLLSPVVPPNIICLGLNYRRHVEECKYPTPPTPLLFFKTTTALCGPGDPIVLPFHNPDEIDYEVELAIVIGVFVILTALLCLVIKANRGKARPKI